jgi:hyperosmotically inducible protein
MNSASKIGKCLSLLGATLFLSAALVAGTVQPDQQPAPDNSKSNPGDSSKGAVTAEQQKMNPADRNTSKQIRSAIDKDKSLSTYAPNIKIITQDGKVTLHGPVRTEDEKAGIAAKAAAVVGADNAANQLEVAPANQ